MDTTQKPREEVHRPQSAGAPRKPKTAADDRPAPRRRPAEGAKKGKKSAVRLLPLKKKAPEKKKAAPKKTDPTKGERPPRKPAEDEVAAKKRAYGNSKPKKNAVTAVSEAIQKTAQKSAAKKKHNPNRPKQPTPAVIYTQPQTFNRNRLLVQLMTITAIVAAVVMSLAVFFKVEHITISGAEVYDPYVIEKASGIQKKTATEPGDNLLTFSRPRAGALIKANLPYVDTVRFGIKLPGTVNIIIEEDEVVYAIKDQVDAWWLINSDGRVVEQGTGSKAANHTQVLGVQIESPVPDTIAMAVETVSTETYPEGDPNAGAPVPVVQTNAQRLTAALQILKALEANDIVGSAASVDVTRLEDIILWYGTRYQVNLGDSANLEYKITCMNDVILQMSDYQSGILDISFTIWPDQVGYTPFA